MTPRRPQDATLRNIRATRTQVKALTARVARIERLVKALARR